MHFGSCLILPRQSGLQILTAPHAGPKPVLPADWWERQLAAGSCLILSRQSGPVVFAVPHAGPKPALPAGRCRGDTPL